MMENIQRHVFLKTKEGEGAFWRVEATYWEEWAHILESCVN